MKKKSRIMAICFGLLTMLGGCELFTWPFSLIEELLPIAIKYAPYALMFLEAPEVAPPVMEANAEVTTPRPDAPTTTVNSKQTAVPVLTVGEVLQQEFQRRAGQPCYVLAIQLQDAQDWEKVSGWARQYQCMFKVRCVPALCDLSSPGNYEKLQGLVAQQDQLLFYADGPLQGLSLIPANLAGKPLAAVAELKALLTK